MSLRRVELAHGGRGTRRASRSSNPSSLGELVGAEDLEQAEEAVRVVLERRGREEQRVPVQARDGRDRAVGGVAGMARGPAQMMRLVHDQQVDSGCDRLLGEARTRDQRVETDHRMTVDVERIESGAEIALDVREPGLVQEHEDLVVLAPQLPQPLHGQRLGRDHERALGAPRADQVVRDQARLDRLSEADLVREQPPHRVLPGRLEGDVELMREETDPARR